MKTALLVFAISLTVALSLFFTVVTAAFYANCRLDPHAEDWSQSVGCYYWSNGTKIPTFLHPEVVR
jgi:accessory gene regulator protein AgrB